MQMDGFGSSKGLHGHDFSVCVRKSLMQSEPSVSQETGLPLTLPVWMPGCG